MSDELESYLKARLTDTVDRRRFLKLGVTAAGIAAIAACGGSTTTGPTGPTGPEFKLGVVLPYSGVYAELGNSITNGMKMYFDSVGNQAGNRKITMVTADEQVALADAVAATKKVVEQDGVDMVAGYVSSPNAAGNRNYLDGLKMPTLIANAGVNSLSRAAKSAFIYRTSFSNWQPSHPMGTYVYDKLGKKRIQLVYANYGAGIESTGSFKETFTAAGGTIVGPDVKTPFPNNGDQTPFVQAIQTDKIDGIYCFLSGTDAVTFLKKAAELGTLKKLSLVSGSGFFLEQDVLAAITDAAPDGAITGLHWALTLPNKENQDFISKYSKKFAGRQADVLRSGLRHRSRHRGCAQRGEGKYHQQRRPDDGDRERVLPEPAGQFQVRHGDQQRGPDDLRAQDGEGLEAGLDQPGDRSIPRSGRPRKVI